jgi:hypothetical protein
MRDAVHGLVGNVGGEVVEQHHRRAEFHEIMLDRQNLPTIAQRTLRQQPDLGQAVENHPAWPAAFYRLENLLGGFAEFEIGRIEQALLLLRIQQAFGRQQLEYLDAIAQRPAMRRGAGAQFTLGFRQRDVEAFFAGARAFEQELQRHGGLAGTRRALYQEQVTAGKSA